MHDACINGLMHHTYRMMESALSIRHLYPEANWDLVIAGVIIHDIGKIDEFSTDHFGLVKEYSRRGELLGHQIIGIGYLNQCVNSLYADGTFNVDDELCIDEYVDLLSHMLESHHGRPEYGSAKPPAFMEAQIINYLDEMDAKIVMFKEAENELQPGTVSVGKPFGIGTRVYRPSFK